MFYYSTNIFLILPGADLLLPAAPSPGGAGVVYKQIHANMRICMFAFKHKRFKNLCVFEPEDDGRNTQVKFRIFQRVTISVVLTLQETWRDEQNVGV